MKIKSVKIVNYKSFLDMNNVIELDDINTLIGKNESGKSNFIECLASIDFTGFNDNSFFDKKNKNTSDPIIFSAVLEPYAFEKSRFKIAGPTILTINNYFDIDVAGSYSEMLNKNKVFIESKNKMNELYSDSILSVFRTISSKDNFKNIISMINNSDSKLFIDYSYINDILTELSDDSNYEEFHSNLSVCVNFLRESLNLFPKFIEIKNISLKTKYSYSDLDNDFNNKLMLKHLLNCCGYTLDDIKVYWSYLKEEDRYNFQEEFNDKIRTFINGFNSFYSQEKVEMRASFQSDSLNFVIRTTKKYIDYEERSNGLKWYLNLYIQLVSKIKSTNVSNKVVLIDEPGVCLHVNAQKELLNFFEDLVLRSNQIIYTTHSPFMIYTDKLYRTRLVIKDEDGNSNMSNRYYSMPHKMGSKMETLAPLLDAIGMNMPCNLFGIADDKINIITEGISDYNYIKAYFISKNISDFNLIPSSGVDNIHNIVSILLGWGCKVKVILDQDAAGRREYKVLINKLCFNPDDIVFIDASNIPSTTSYTIEDAFSINDKDIIGINNDDYDGAKAYYSLETLKRIENKEYNYSNDTLKKFDELFSRFKK